MLLNGKRRKKHTTPILMDVGTNNGVPTSMGRASVAEDSYLRNRQHVQESGTHAPLRRLEPCIYITCKHMMYNYVPRNEGILQFAM